MVKFNVDRILKERGLTRRQLALQNGLMPEQLYAWNKGIYLPSVSNAVKLMQALDCSFEDIFEITVEGN